MRLEATAQDRRMARSPEEKGQNRVRDQRRGGAMVFRQHAVHDVLVDIDSKRVRDDAGNSRTPEPGIGLPGARRN